MNSADPCLVLETNGRRFPLSDGQSWAVGRGDGCAVMLDSRSVSRLHALIQKRDSGEFALVDLGSRNGSFVNNKRVSLPMVLRNGDRLVLGDQELQFRSDSRSNAALTEPELSTRNAPTTSLHTHSLTTIVVVDIRDFTPLARSVPEEVLSQTIGTWFLRVGQIAQSQGSWAQKYIGDCMMAVWVHDNPAHLNADLVHALESVSRINAMTSEIHRTLPLPAPLRIGAGVNTGPAIVGGSDYTALGDTVNAAFRLEAATKEIGLGVALGERTFNELKMPVPSPFSRRQVSLKGYDSLTTTWAISFDELQRYLKEWAT
jgi:adenylate cyclase